MPLDENRLLLEFEKLLRETNREHINGAIRRFSCPTGGSPQSRQHVCASDVLAFVLAISMILLYSHRSVNVS